MPALVLLVVVIAVVMLLAKSVHDAQQARDAKAGGAATPPASPARRRAPARPRRRRPAIDEQKLAEHVAKLRKAVEAGLITPEEATASIVRQTDGQLSEDAARHLLGLRDAA